MQLIMGQDLAGAGLGVNSAAVAHLHDCLPRAFQAMRQLTW